MKVYESYPGMYQYKLLPAFAQFLLDHHLEELNREQLRHSKEINLPLLQHMQHLPEDDLLAFSQASLKEYLHFLAQNKAKEGIETSLERWLSDQLTIIKRFEVIVEDITLINYIRSSSFRKFIPLYTSDLPTALGLMEEIDNLLTGSTTSSVGLYMDLLKERISHKEEQLLDAQSIARVGSFTWDLVNDVSENTPEMRYIMEHDFNGTSFQAFMGNIHPEDMQRVESALREAMETGYYECEFRYNVASGIKVLWVRGVVSFKDHKPVQMQGTVQDITERKRIEDTLLHKTLELERSNLELQHFASIASHDLKEPLRKISMYTEMVLRKEGDVLSETSKSNMTRVMDAGLRMQNLVEDLLAYSSLAQQQERQKVNLEFLFEEVLELLDQRIQEKQALISSDGLPEAVVLPFQFQQLMQNLLTNSLKFVQEGRQPQISITHKYLLGNEVPEGVRPAETYLQLTFTDNGIGFEQDAAEKIFGLFNRLHSRTQYEGTGLGLAICRKVAENHGGVIQASAEPGKGAQFFVVIPQD